MRTVFHLLRHASHDQLGRVLTGRSPGVALSASGRAEASALGRRLAGRIDAIYTSPQERAAETAAIVAVGAGVPAPRRAAELDEIDFGAWSGQPFAALEAQADWRRWNTARDAARPPGGESMAEVAARLARLFERLRAAHPGGAVALVSHGDVIKAAVCQVLGLPFGRLHRFEIAPASLTTVAQADWGATLMVLNEGCRPAEGRAA